MPALRLQKSNSRGGPALLVGVGAPVEVVGAQVAVVGVPVVVVVGVPVVVVVVAERKEWSGDVIVAVSCRSRLSELHCRW